MIYTLNDKQYEGATSLDLMRIEYLHFDVDFSRYDAIVITSRNALKALLNKYKIPSHIKIYAIGKNSAKEKQRIDFVATSNNANDFAEELVVHLKNKKVLYPRAKIVSSDMAGILRLSNIQIDELIVYENIKQVPKIKKLGANSIIIFSASSLVNYFFEYYEWGSSYTAISIGKMTSKELNKYIPNFIESKKTDINYCIKMGISLK
ncbi:MAG: Unknown protein [uncultured Campylobacterales bacterium]|uniref:Uroporphyrinogen-III synthase n=1 Tax=uncultured Campylobacterales bacterium TaxID=352960 RepID=A0A6S6TJM8_9BACT|nr:MAG: Unknown protein [uncultured Campylobacterales bacterium]